MADSVQKGKFHQIRPPEEINNLFGVVSYAEIHCELIVEALIHTGDL